MSSVQLSTYLGLVQEGPEERVLRLLVHLGTQAVSAQQGYLLFLEGDQLLFLLGDTDEHGRAMEGARLRMGQDVAGLAALTLEPHVGRPATADVPFPEGEPALALAAPVIIGESLLGVLLALTSDGGHTFTQADILQFARVASVTALVIGQRSRLDTIRDLQKEQPETAPRSDVDRLGQQISLSVSRIARVAPAQLEQVVVLLRAIEKLCGADLT